MNSAHQALVVFDLDGTLFQSKLVTIPAVQETFAAFGLDVPGAESIGAFIGRPASEYHAWLASLCPQDRAEEIIAATDWRELALIAERGQLFPGAMDSLRRLADLGFALAMSSNAPEDYFDAVLDSQGLRPFFRPALCRGTRFSGKLEMAGEILRQVKARPLIVVGDRADDIESARAHGGLAVAATYGHGAPAEWELADARAGHASELAATVESISRVCASLERRR